jgi:hypothetical protein
MTRWLESLILVSTLAPVIYFAERNATYLTLMREIFKRTDGGAILNL